jgi:hypothetical protein
MFLFESKIGQPGPGGRGGRNQYTGSQGRQAMKAEFVRRRQP